VSSGTYYIMYVGKERSATGVDKTKNMKVAIVDIETDSLQPTRSIVL
jgi:hypothetical protein